MKKLILLLIITFHFILVSCTNSQPTSECQINELILDKSDFPSGTVVDDISSPIDEYPSESAGRTAGYGKSLIYHVVGNYSSIRQAKLKYSNEDKYKFESDKYRGPWVTPEEITYESPIADQYHIACGPVQTEYQCRMIARYEEYYVFFFAYVSEDGLNFNHLQEMLKSIDKKMEACLQGNN